MPELSAALVSASRVWDDARRKDALRGLKAVVKKTSRTHSETRKRASGALPVFLIKVGGASSDFTPFATTANRAKSGIAIGI